ncbi:glycosyltransferase family 4 protein [Halomicrobium salinisoli]|uniref:glycosyltransferase family 4 protein n=1 Tax=Halomicrobium salinisoli TaxID=2878391 RepID=UPI001CF01C46|nr:glycosyltransferase family 4 protein [Halomicrobium salinisoli]
MRVAFVSMKTSHYRDTKGARRLERLARQMADAGHDVTVYCARWWDGDERRFEPDDISYRAVTAEPNAAAFAARLPVRIARNGADVVHARPTPPESVPAAKLGGALARAPLLVDWFGDEALPGGRRTEWAARAPDRIVTPSEMVRTNAREQGADGDATTVIPESIDVDLIRETEPAETVDVAFAHPLDESANVESLMLGLAELRERDWSATIIGDGPYREDYERQARDLRIDDRVTFAGACDREERVSLYRGAHVFVQTAYREQFATELLWALACGCVGIVEYQARSSAHELIEQRERSFRVTSTQGMAEAIVDAGTYERRTFDEAFAEFDHDAVRGEYEDLYARLIDERGLF